ncbi:MAG: hypothetical protein HY062_14360 [Bacteroidetes bacterium]|nr:hypothetical protein [Bacteroidota bacterium]
MFPETKVTLLRDCELTWIHSITPSPLGDTYKVKLVYHLTESPKVYVVDPKPLLLAEGKQGLPHCYDQKKQRLCLYYPKYKEWDKTMLLTATVIPWTFEWLYHYEIWLGTGEWHGGGIHNSSKKEESNDKK